MQLRFFKGWVIFPGSQQYLLGNLKMKIWLPTLFSDITYVYYFKESNDFYKVDYNKNRHPTITPVPERQTVLTLSYFFHYYLYISKECAHVPILEIIYGLPIIQNLNWELSYLSHHFTYFHSPNRITAQVLVINNMHLEYWN